MSERPSYAAARAAHIAAAEAADHWDVVRRPNSRLRGKLVPIRVRVKPADSEVDSLFDQIFSPNFKNPLSDIFERFTTVWRVVPITPAMEAERERREKVQNREKLAA